MFEQSLLELNLAGGAKCFYENLQRAGFEYQEVDIGDVTFKAGQTEPVHRWYRLTPSYSPGLVRFLINEFQITQNHFVIDPFSGRGTTVIECQKRGIPALGIEINPLLQQAGHRSLKWESESLHLMEQYLIEVSELIAEYKQLSIEDVIEIFDTRIPIIHNVFRWWKSYILKELIICRQVMLKSGYSSVHNYLWLALNKACLDCANIHRNHPTISFDDNHQREINVLYEVSSNLQTIRNDIGKLGRHTCFSELNSIVLGDSTKNLNNQIDRAIDFVITSPPYPNRYSYVHQTRPQLHFMEILENVGQATEIDLQAVGGTWGRATSILQNQLLDVPTEIQPYLCYYEELEKRSILMCNYATKYFIDMWHHIKALREAKSADFRGAYVVGNSRLSDVEIFTETILGNLFKHEGFEVEKIVSFRKRGGKKRLYETAICVRG
ncbi:site-specific DNA-methyltransferase [Pseudanabaenaceae cyanobacterium LEGE 13415]|nr:site-specific DNA-methyltransferase [Pseudanabaenaceae cyanobacterium LEGE 13415]